MTGRIHDLHTAGTSDRAQQFPGTQAGPTTSARWDDLAYLGEGTYSQAPPTPPAPAMPPTLRPGMLTNYTMMALGILKENR